MLDVIYWIIGISIWGYIYIGINTIKYRDCMGYIGDHGDEILTIDMGVSIVMGVP